MSSRRNLVYIVEGETEEKLIKTLRSDLQCIRSGRVLKFNVIQNIIRTSVLLAFNPDSDFILLFDTDCNNAATLEKNIKIIENFSKKTKTYTIPQVMNLEDELMYSCSLKDIRLIKGSRSEKDFKRDLLRMSNLCQKLTENNFDIRKLWSRNAYGEFKILKNDSEYIKLHHKIN